MAPPLWKAEVLGYSCVQAVRPSPAALLPAQQAVKRPPPGQAMAHGACYGSSAHPQQARRRAPRRRAGRLPACAACLLPAPARACPPPTSAAALAVMLLRFLLFTSAAAAAAAATAAKSPHILFILVDDLGYADVGFNRAQPDREVVSPALDELVASGVRLTRHYVHQYCTPTRTSVQSGRLPVHVSTGLGSPCGDNTGISQNMTGFAERLKGAGYTTAFAGKWDAGMVTPAHTPHGRGYDTSLNYFSHKNDFWSQANMQTCCEPDQTIIDFWRTDHGASDVNSTGYSEWLYRDELVGIIQKHEPTKPLLVFYAPHVAHCPLQVPKEYYDKFNYMSDDEGKCAAQTVKGLHSIDPHFPEMEYKCRQQYHAMVMVMDVVVGNITAAFKAKGMWDDLLVVMSSDNGGPVDLAENAANNWPKRGGKYSLFEGGISVAAFVSGGYLPQAVRGTTNNNIVHIADWYATFCHLAGVDPTDQRAATAVPAVPPIDSLNVWPLISGETKVSPRATLPLPIGKNCLVLGEWKLITTGTSPNFWQGLSFPNASSSADHKAAYIAALRSSLEFNEHQGTDVHHHQVAAAASVQLPPRPYPRLMPCGAAARVPDTTQNQSWLVDGEGFPSSQPGNVCSASDPNLCWNVQGGHSTNRLILYSKSHETNSDFLLKPGGKLWNPLLGEEGCIGAHHIGGELVLLDDCASAVKAGAIAAGFKFDAQTGEIKTLVAGAEMCVTASCCTNSSTPNRQKGDSAYLFNVVADPTEQTNLINETSQASRVAQMTKLLESEVESFFSNRDRFEDDCPSNLDPEKDLGCACWMAKHKYGGFMGPFAMLPRDDEGNLL